MRNSPELVIRVEPEHSIVNLRCNLESPGVRDTLSTTLGLALPEGPNTTVHNNHLRIVWIGPDEWQLLSLKHDPYTLESWLRKALPDAHMGITDVSSNYRLMHLSGDLARDILANGCPLDLHPRIFKPGHCAGSHYFKAAIWLWKTDSLAYELLVRRSFFGYVQLMLERASAESPVSTA